MNTNIPIIAIFDYDNEGFTQLKGLTKNGLYKQISITPEFKHIYVNEKFNNIFAMLLPPPDYRQPFIDDDESRYCYLTTELLYENSEINSSNRAFPSKNDNSVFSFKGDKMAYAQKIEDRLNNSESINLNGFIHLFSLIDKVIKACC